MPSSQLGQLSLESLSPAGSGSVPYNPSTQKGEAGELRVQGQPGLLQSDVLSGKQENNNRKLKSPM
jgi:hypothetical protein